MNKIYRQKSKNEINLNIAFYIFFKNNNNKPFLQKVDAHIIICMEYVYVHTKVFFFIKIYIQVYRCKYYIKSPVSQKIGICINIYTHRYN